MELGVNAVAHAHRAGDVGDLGEVVVVAGRDLLEYQSLRRAAAQQHRYLVLQLRADIKTGIRSAPKLYSRVRRRRAG